MQLVFLKMGDIITNALQSKYLGVHAPLG